MVSDREIEEMERAARAMTLPRHMAIAMVLLIDGEPPCLKDLTPTDQARWLAVNQFVLCGPGHVLRLCEALRAERRRGGWWRRWWGRRKETRR